MSASQAARRRGEEHAKLVREAAKIVGSDKNPEAFDRAFLSKAHADAKTSA